MTLLKKLSISGAVLMAVLTLTLSGCDLFGDDESTSTDYGLDGLWKITSLTDGDGVQYSPFDFEEDGTETQVFLLISSNTVKFYAIVNDGSPVACPERESFSITSTTVDTPDIDPFNYSLAGDTMTFTRGVKVMTLQSVSESTVSGAQDMEDVCQIGQLFE